MGTRSSVGQADSGCKARAGYDGSRTARFRAGGRRPIGAFLFLGLALLIALGFEFVNGFHDTVNAVATVIDTHSLKPVFAVLWSGVWNFVGVMVSTGAVAYSIITLLPVDLILNVGSAGGYAMIFALLIAAVVWNLGTWFMGLPNSSSRALIGSVLGVGVGLANQWLDRGQGAAAGVEWGQAHSVLLALLVSPVMGFVGAMLLLWVMKRVLPDRVPYAAPKRETPPPFPMRVLLVFTCTAVSFAHGSNDGQKGMGLIMPILIGVAPTAYALNRTMPDSATPTFIQAASQAQGVFAQKASGATLEPREARAMLEQALRTRRPDTPQVYAALDRVSDEIVGDLKSYGSLRRVPTAETRNVRNEMYLVYDTLRLLTQDADVSAVRFPNGGDAALTRYRRLLEQGTRYVPTWVKVAVALGLGLGLGTMIGWKRIVVTVGERIGTAHLTYGMGAAAELVAASTILLAQFRGPPVWTTHILSSGVAGTMVAGGSGL